MLLTIETLGEMTLRWEDGRTFVPSAPRELQLLEALVTASDFRVPASVLSERLWPGSRQADVPLANVIAELHEGIGSSDDGKPLFSFDGWIGFEPWSGPSVDAFAFEAEARALLASAAGSDAEIAASAAAAAALARRWNGEFLPASREAATVRRRGEIAGVRAALLACASSVDAADDALLQAAFDATPHDAEVAALLVSRLVARGEHRRAAAVRNHHARARHARDSVGLPHRSSLPAFVTSVAPRVAIAEREAFVRGAVTAAGACAAFVVRGGWGAGKTRTLADLALAAEAAGWRVGFYAAQSIDGDVPPATIHFRLAAALASDGDTERYRATIEDILSGARPAMVIVDDAHFLSDATISSLLGMVAENTGRSAPVFAASTRTENVGALCASSPSLRSLNASFLELTVPTADDIERIVSTSFGGRVAPRALGLVSAIWPGNLHAIARAAKHTLSSGIIGRTERGFDVLGDALPAPSLLVDAPFHFAVEAKFAALDAAARSVLRAMSFAGEGATLAELASATGSDAAEIAAALDALERAGLIEERGVDRVRIPPLVASIAAAGVGRERASELSDRFAAMRRGSSV